MGDLLQKSPIHGELAERSSAHADSLSFFRLRIGSIIAKILPYSKFSPKYVSMSANSASNARTRSCISHIVEISAVTAAYAILWSNSAGSASKRLAYSSGWRNRACSNEMNAC